MALAGREWPVSTGRAACATRDACVRLLLLVGIATIAWLAWGVGTAHGEADSEAEGAVGSVPDMITEHTAATEAPEELEATEYPDAPEVTEAPEATVDEETVHTEDTMAREATGATEDTGDTVGEEPTSADESGYTGDSASTEEPVHTGDTVDEETGENRLSDTVARVGSTTGYLTAEVVPRVTSLPGHALDETGVTSALEESATGEAATRVVDDTVDVVDDTARGAGQLVGEVTRTGQDVVDSTDDSLRESRLVGTVAGGLSDSTQFVNDRAVNHESPVELPVLGFTDELATHPATSADSETKRSGADSDGDSEDGRTGAATAQTSESTWRAAVTEAAEAAAAFEQAVGDDAFDEHFRLIGEGTVHSAGSDATGASAPSFPTPGAAGYLVPRADHMVPRGQRVTLHGDPILVVRDSADDPSVSPD